MDCQPKRMPRFDGCVNRGQSFWQRTVGVIADLLLPDACGLCGKPGKAPGYCSHCITGLARHENQCRICGVASIGNGLCGRCQLQPPPIVETVAPYRYAPPVNKAIHNLKYHRKLACGRDLGYLLTAELKRRKVRTPDVLVPVPLHWQRQFWRGFNHSLEIARPISSTLDIPIDSSLVTRKLHTDPQVGLTTAQRRANIRRAFRATRQPMPASVAIIDDVVTSGSTVSEMAYCLHAAGVKEIYIWAVARA